VLNYEVVRFITMLKSNSSAEHYLCGS